MAEFSLFVTRMGEAKLATGATGEAQDFATRALDAARKYKERGSEAWALYLLGEVCVHRPSPDLSVTAQRYGAALTAADALGMRPLVARCHERLGELYLGGGDRARASDHSTAAATMFREMGIVPAPQRRI
jgi:hypothetical protein